MTLLSLDRPSDLRESICWIASEPDWEEVNQEDVESDDDYTWESMESFCNNAVTVQENKENTSCCHHPASFQQLFQGCILCPSHESNQQLPSFYMPINTPESQMKKLACSTFDIPFESMAKLLFGRNNSAALNEFFLKMHAKMEHTDVCIGPWKADFRDKAVLSRVRTFRTKTGAPIGPSTTRVQLYDRLVITDDQIVLYSVSQSLDAMYSSDFAVEGMYVISRVGTFRCELKRLVSVHFINSIMFWSGKIKSEVYKCATKEVKFFMELLENHVF